MLKLNQLKEKRRIKALLKLYEEKKIVSWLNGILYVVRTLYNIIFLMGSLVLLQELFQTQAVLAADTDDNIRLLTLFLVLFFSLLNLWTIWFSKEIKEGLLTSLGLEVVFLIATAFLIGPQIGFLFLTFLAGLHYALTPEV